MTKQRIILLSNLFPNAVEPTRGLYNQRLLEALRELGHPVEVIAPVASFPGKSKLPPRSEKINGIPVAHPRFFYTPGCGIHYHYLYYRWMVRPCLRQRIAAAKQRVHLILGFIYPDAVAMAPICQAAKIPYSVLVLGSDFRIRIKQTKFAPRVLNCLQTAPAIFCPGQALKSDIVAAGIASQHVHPFKNGVDPNIFYPREPLDPRPRERSKNILFVGNLVEVKAPDRLIRAFHQACARIAPETRLTLVGDGPLLPGLKKLVASLGLEGHVLFAGRLPPKSVAEKMRSSAVFCLCSRSEGMPNVVLEALACGCPIVATGVGEIPYLIDPKFNGACIDTIDRSESEIVSRLSDALVHTLKAEWERVAIAARMQGYRWEKAAQTILQGINRRATAPLANASEKENSP